MKLTSTKGFIIGYKFGFNGKLLASEIRITDDGGAYATYLRGLVEFIPAKKLKRYSFIESIETGRRLYNLSTGWAGGDA